MIIKVNNNNEIIQLIRIGGDKNEEGCIEVLDIPQDILDDIFSYKYIEGHFVRRADADEQHIITARRQKRQFLSETCQSIIESGIQIGNDHYSLSYADQINLSKLASQAVMYPDLPLFYHADGKLCRQYTKEEILYIGQIAEAWVIYHTTYHNFAKAYINELTDFDAIAAFKYGSRIEDAELYNQMVAITETTQVVFDAQIDDPFDYSSILHPTRENNMSDIRFFTAMNNL